MHSFFQLCCMHEIHHFESDHVCGASATAEHHVWLLAVLGRSMVRIFGLHQNNRYFAQSLSRTIGTIRYVVSFSVGSETNGKRSHEKPSKLPSNYTSYRKHEQRSRSDSRIKKTSQLPRGSGPREARLAYMALLHLEMELRGKPNLRFKFHTMASP